jgi:type I restriction enzyme S subunit
MNPGLLVKQFDRISDAPGAIPRLRKFVLDLAVRGKLVEQDPTDETASALIKRVHLRKAEIAKEGTVKKEKPFPPLAENAIPFLIPPTWTWSQIAEIGFINPRNTAEDQIQASFVPMPRISAEYGVSNTHEVRPWGEIKNGFTHFAEGDVGLAKITPCFENGKSSIFRGLTGGIGAGTTELHIVRPVIVLADYILIFLKSPHFIESGTAKMTGTAGQKRVSTEYFAYSPFPLPPLSEQRRIVAKVDELMALCDRFETAQWDRETGRNSMAAAALYHLSNGADADAFREHARFCIERLPQITTRSQQISTLRRAVLNLAVRGRLVAQDPNDEPVAGLLMQNDRARQKIACEDRRADPDRQVLLAAESKWKVPPSWGSCALADLVLFIDYRGKTPNKTDRGVRLITAKNVKKGFINISPEEFLSERDYHAWMTRGFPRVGDILFTTEAPMGNAAVVRLSERFALAQRVICFRPYRAVNPDFLVLQLLAEPFLSILEKTATGLTAKGIKAAKLKCLPIAVPPLPEQLRIVARVDELMVLCDKLEALLTTAQTETSRLLEAVLHHSINGVDEVPERGVDREGVK